MTAGDVAVCEDSAVEARVGRWWIGLLGLGLAVAPASLAGEPHSEPSDGDEDPQEPALDEVPVELWQGPVNPLLDARTVVPWRDTVHGVPVPGALRPPEVALQRRPNRLQAWIEGTPSERPEIGSLDRAGEVPEAAITARTIPEPPPRPAAASDEEIVVWGDRLERARAAVQQRLEDLGYKEGRTKDGRTHWTPEAREDRWKPRIWLDDDGWFTLDTPAATYEKVGFQNNSVRLPDAEFSPALSRNLEQVVSYGPTFRTSTKGQRFAVEAKVTRQLTDVVEALRLAQGDRGLSFRLEGLPDELDRLWHEGLGPDGHAYPDVYSRQAALLQLWADRTRTRAGETVRRAIGNYLLGEVDPVSPLPPELVARAEARCECVLGEAIVAP
jgi:hypothetical protein